MAPTTLSLYAMATRFEVVLFSDDPARLRAAGEEALAEIERLDPQLSFYSCASEISRINARAASEPVRVDPRLFRLLERCADLSRLTDGAFDVTIAPLVQAWGFTGTSGSVPDQDRLRSALDVVGMTHVLLDPNEHTVRFDRPGVLIDLGAVGKGYAIEQAVEILRECSVTSGLIHGGTSTVYGIGSPPDQDSWRVGIADPNPSPTLPATGRELLAADGVLPPRCGEGWGGVIRETVDLRDSALSVSAVHGKSFVEGGTEYGHVIDPRTGQAVAGTLLAAVTGPSPTDSDALSTALLVLSKPGLDLLGQSFPEYRGIVSEAST